MFISPSKYQSVVAFLALWLMFINMSPSSSELSSFPVHALPVIFPLKGAQTLRRGNHRWRKYLLILCLRSPPLRPGIFKEIINNNNNVKENIKPFTDKIKWSLNYNWHCLILVSCHYLRDPHTQWTVLIPLIQECKLATKFFKPLQSQGLETRSFISEPTVSRFYCFLSLSQGGWWEVGINTIAPMDITISLWYENWTLPKQWEFID